MKVFLINFVEKEVAKKLAQRGVDIVYWTGKEQHYGDARQEKKYSNTIFHSVFDALKAIPAKEIMNLKLDFPSKEVLKSMTGIEYQVLAMISRADFTGMTHDKKVDLFYRYIIYWYGVLKHFKPEAIVFTDVPHLGFSYVVYVLAKELGIKTVMYRFMKGLPSRLFFFDDFSDMKSLKFAYGQALAGKIRYENLSDEMKKYLQTQNEINNVSALTYAPHIDKLIKQGTKIPKALVSFRAIINNIKQGIFFPTVIKYFFMLGHKRDILAVDEEKYNGLQIWWLYRKWNKIKKKYRREYESLQVEVDYNKNYVYVPLHLQPECNTNPLGGIYDDQILLVRTLAASIPPDWLIYVKENPMQWLHYQGNFGRYSGYYDSLVEIPNVRLVRADTSTFKLINNAQAVATVSGSAGLESLIRLKPVLLFGFGWYMDCDGVFRVEDVVSCRKALDIIKSGYKLNQDNLFAFLHAIDRVSIYGSFNKRYSQFSSVNGEENSTNITNKLLNELNLS
ncbi:MAG: hypothetical protein AAB390_04305 [Patescibacteria group bacterium]